MAGNSSRRGAVRKGSGGNPTAGSGGRVRRGLEGRGPTPKAEEREGHKAYRAKQRGSRDDQPGSSGGGRGGSGRPGSRSGPGGRRGAGRSGDTEWVAGRNSVVEALRANLPVTGVYVAEGAERDGRLREVFRVVADRGISLLEVGRGELDRMTGGAVHQGLAAKVPAYEYAHPDDLLDRAAEAGEPALIVALDSVTDPRNLGAVVRSAAGFGAHGVVVPERRAAGMTASAWKSSAGAAARVPVAMAGNLTRQLKSYQEAGCMVVGLAADGEVDLRDLDLADGPLVLVVGAEGDGMSRLVAETCDVTAAIPMASSLESLNAGVAAGIALYEISRRRAAR
jgi:23S rRNA (guanosine2251-2'-O)-methyltransferase